MSFSRGGTPPLSECTVSNGSGEGTGQENERDATDAGRYLGRTKVDYVLHVRCPTTGQLIPATEDDVTELSRLLSARAKESWLPSTPAIHLRSHGPFVVHPKPLMPTSSMRPGGPCDNCEVTKSPQWRRGPPEKPVLCNACGTRWRRTNSLTKEPPMTRQKSLGVRGGVMKRGSGDASVDTTEPNSPIGATFTP